MAVLPHPRSVPDAMGTESLVRAGLPSGSTEVPWDATSPASSLPKGTKAEESLGFHSEEGHPLIYQAPDLLGPGQWGARPGGWGRTSLRRGLSLRRSLHCTAAILLPFTEAESTSSG